jgi:hypothetical protein
MTRLPPQTDPPLSPRQTLPTMYDLPSENPEKLGLPDEFHFLQPLLLFLTFQPPIAVSSQLSAISFFKANLRKGFLN